jgi:hypothetical protein
MGTNVMPNIDILLKKITFFYLSANKKQVPVVWKVRASACIMGNCGIQ